MEQVEPIAGPPDAPPAPAHGLPVENAAAPTPPLSAAPAPIVEPLPLAEPELSASAADPPGPAPAAAAQRTIYLLAPTQGRRLTESLVLFAAAIIFVRALAVEPFGVPTGSMAPTLCGNHKVAICPRCGYQNLIGEPGRQHSGYDRATCQNCGQGGINIEKAIEIAGDRLLVDKNLYSMRSPRRWEPAVFRCPSDLSKPYVKRVIGLPGERIQIQDGDIYINGALARKTLTEAFEIRVPVFDQDSAPYPDGWRQCWSIEPKPAKAPPMADDRALSVRSREIVLDGSQAAETPVWASYRHRRFDGSAGDDREEAIRDIFVYNGGNGESGSSPVHDFLFECEIEPRRGPGIFYLRVNDGADRVIAALPIAADGPATLQVEKFGPVRSEPLAKRLEINKTYRIRMALVDRRFSIAIDGAMPFAAYDLDPATDRREVVSPLAFGVQDTVVAIRDLKIYRDVYYRAAGRNAIEEPLHLGQDEYFMLGDNTANSDDSRSWPIPGVPERNFLGKPFLLHQPSRITHLEIGRWQRYFQAIDWSRIRVLR